MWASVPAGNYLMRRIIWRAGRVASRSWKSASFVISSVSLPQNPTALTRPNARSTLTDRLACLRGGGGGKKGAWMNGKEKKNPHPPTGRQGALTERNSSRLCRRGRYRVPFSTSSFLLLLESRPPFSPLLTRTFGLPGTLFCLLSNAEQEPPPPPLAL